jgi:succinate dehydrogenase / fumarate reductase cytochrome b subunit
VGLLLVAWGLIALAGGEESFDCFTACVGSPVGIILMIGWSWSLFYHLCNGIRHLVQDAGYGYEIVQFVRSSWTSIIVSLLLTVAAWAYVLNLGAGA